MASKTVPINIGGKKLYATLTGDVSSKNGLYVNGKLFRLSEEPDGEVKGCLSLFCSITTSSVWKNNSVSLSDDQLESLYLLILPYIKIDVDSDKIFQMYSDCYTVAINTRDDGTYEDETVIRGGENPEVLVKRIVYGGNFDNQVVRRKILQYLFDYYWNESYEAKVLRQTMLQNLWIPQSIFDANVHFLIQKGLVDPFFDTSKQLISVSISQKGIEYVENSFQEPTSAVQVIQNMGDTINTTIKGTGNVVNIKGQLNQLFLSIETEIEAKNEPNKTEVLEQITELKSEMEGSKDFGKIQAVLDKLKGSAAWVHEKIVKHPVVAQVIAQAVANQIGLK